MSGCRWERSGEERLGARVSLIVDGETAGQALVRTIWTDDTVKSTRMNRRVARARNEEELADLIQVVVDSHRAGDLRQATDRAEDALRIADAEGNDGVKERIATMFDEDPAHRAPPSQGQGRRGRGDGLRDQFDEDDVARCAHQQRSDDACHVPRAATDLRRRTTATSVAWPSRLRRSKEAEETSACPNCGSPTGSGTQCPACGSVLGAGDTLALWASQQWEVVVRPDRTYFDMLEPDGMEFPADPYTGRIALTGDHVRIGRHSKTKGITPDIDLSGDLEDTGVSHRHAVLMRQPSGSWALVDQDSTNGTFLNAEEDPLPPNQPVALSHGDQVHVGAWTTLTLERLVLVDTGHGDQDSRPSKDTRNIAHGRKKVEIDLLGPLCLRVKGEEVPITARLERAVLARLALNVGTPVSTGNLEAALWGDREPVTSNKSLQGKIVNLRERLPEGTIETVQSGYCLQAARDAVDVVRFERRCARGRALLASGHPGASVALLTSALDLWRGEPIPDLSDWPEGTAVAVGLRERHACAEEDRFDGRLQLGDHEALVPDLYPAVDAQPLRQRRWAQLMLALYRCNRQKEASNEFRRLGSVLDEYGFVQSDELVTLEEGIVLNRPELQWIPPREAGDGPPPTAA